MTTGRFGGEGTRTVHEVRASICQVDVVYGKPNPNSRVLHPYSAFVANAMDFQWQGIGTQSRNWGWNALMERIYSTLERRFSTVIVKLIQDVSVGIKKINRRKRRRQKRNHRQYKPENCIAWPSAYPNSFSPASRALAG
jgi:hypothetical protein